MGTAYLNGVYAPLEETRVSVLDRGFLLGDGVYEVIPVYSGRLFRLDQHLARLETSLESVRIDNPHARAEWVELLQELVARNGGGDQALYLQVTRGAAARSHAFPSGVSPTVFAMLNPLATRDEPQPAKAVLRSDFRWGRCDIKTIALIGNVLLRQEAIDAGCLEAILVRDGNVTEGAATNVFVVQDDFIATPPKGPQLLGGITRDLVIELCLDADLPVVEAAISEAAIREADEVWVTSSTMEIVPIIELDGSPVGTGRPGPVWRKAWSVLREFRQAQG